MSMVIHHGGSGTTAFGLRAGVPSCAVPFVFDQFYWGQRISQLGVGPDPIPYKKLTVERLREAIEVGVGSPQIKQNAVELGQKIQKENGIETALGIIEKIVRENRRPDLKSAMLSPYVNIIFVLKCLASRRSNEPSRHFITL